MATKRQFRGKRNWTAEEIDLLKKEYSTGRTQDLINLFHRTYSSICHKAHDLGLKNDRLWTQEQLATLERLYPVTDKLELEKELGKDASAIISQANKLSIHKEPVWSKNDEEQLRVLYPFHSNVHLSEMLGRTRMSVRRKANRMGLVKDKESLRKINSESLRKYTLNEDYFKEINTSDKAYILGFLLGDGNVSKKFFRLTIELHKKDIEVLEYIKKMLESDAPIRPTRANKVVLSISSYTLIKDLEKWGMVPRKAHIVKLPKLNPKMYSHLVRGLFDADGSVGVYGQCRCNIRGNREALEQVSQIVSEQTGVTQKVYQYDGTAIYMLGGKRRLPKFAKWLYMDADFYMSRKYNKFLEEGNI